MLAGWVQPCPDTPNLVILASAVVDAIATVKLNGSVALSESDFLKLVEKLASQTEHGTIQ